MESESFKIVCSDGQSVLMDRARLENLLDKMPTLRHLFFGHPQMRQTDLEVQDGFQVVKIPDSLEVTKKAFVEAIHAVFELRSLPALTGVELDLELKLLMDTLFALGGCDEFENRFREHKKQIALQSESAVSYYNPMTPEEDVKQLYHWASLPTSNGLSADFLVNQGLSFTQMAQAHGNPYLLYRKLKSAP